MKLKKILPGFAFLFVLSLVITSCLNDENLIPPNCNDGILNNGEFDVDCGGVHCPACPPSCVNGLWDPDFGEIDIDCGGPNCEACPTCNDEIMNGDEIGIDCGGEDCEPCSTGGSCLNGVLDGAEEGVDCGGIDCPPCEVPTCDDGIMNGDEEGIDCGGTECPACPEPTCDDGVLNGLESGIDCGDGIFCPDCQVASQGQIIFRANNQDFDVYSGATAVIDTLTAWPLRILTLNGNQGSIESIIMNFANAGAINVGPPATTLNAGTAPGGYVVGVEYGVFGNYLSNTASSNLNVIFTSIDVTDDGTTLTGTFAGQIYNFTESYSLTITEGSFNLVTQYAAP